MFPDKTTSNVKTPGLSLAATADVEPPFMLQIAENLAAAHSLVTDLDHGLACIRSTLLGHDKAVVADLPWDPAPAGIVPEQRNSSAMLRSRLEALLNHIRALHAV